MIRKKPSRGEEEVEVCLVETRWFGAQLDIFSGQP